MPELKKNILNFGYRNNVKYEGMLLYSFDRFYVVTKFILPTINDLKFSPIDFDSECNYLDVNLGKHRYPALYLPNIKNFVRKLCHLLISIRIKLIIIMKQFMIF